MTERSDTPLHLLLVDDDDVLREACRRLLESEQLQVTATADPLHGLELAAQQPFPIALVDFRMPGMTGIEFIQRISLVSPHTAVILMTGYATIEMAVEAIKMGARDYIAKPFEPHALMEIIRRIAGELPIPSAAGEEKLSFEFNGKPVHIIGKSPAMQKVFGLVTKVASTDSTVLVQGESGTGKELIARAIHAFSHRAAFPFIAMDCGSLVESLFESELFGHIKGSFTGATATKHGAFELAEGGTFFFDEIGNISLNVQAKILRAIQEKEIRRVGASQSIKIDVRLIAATNLDLQTAVSQGSFREDLFYRLSVIPIHLPALRERKEDLPLLITAFLQKYNLRRRKTPLLSLTPEAEQALLQYHWPGNIRELENVLERAAVVEDSDRIELHSLPLHLQQPGKSARPSVQEELVSLQEMEKRYISQVLTSQNYNISQAARILGVDRKTLYQKIKKFDLKQI
ncbi:MAG TPA: sigma-54 dependent transcriptional regulator [bacterium]|nr:sigma-54 dependent transcriptional regulator [bacterium]HPN34311.1 sigma-54 dependent transcriptional regulator [bacterium]